MKNTYKLLTIILTIFFLAEIYIIVDMSGDIKESTNVYEEQIAVSKVNLQVIKDSSIRQMEYQGEMLPIKSLKNINNETEKVEDIFDKTTLVIFITPAFCSSCLTDIIEQLKKNKSFDRKAIFLFSDFKYRDLLSMYKSWNVPILCYFDDSEERAFTNMTQSMFTVNNNLKVVDVFYPVYGAEELTERYLKLINIKLNKK